MKKITEGLEYKAMAETKQLKSLMESLDRIEEGGSAFKKGEKVNVERPGDEPVVGTFARMKDGWCGIRVNGEMRYCDPNWVTSRDSGLSMSTPGAKHFKNKPDHVTRRSGR